MTEATLYRMVTDDHVCPYGLKAKLLLKLRGFSVEDHPLESREETDAFKEEHGVKTTPQVFIAGERVGGYEALKERFGLETPGRIKRYQPVLALFGTTALMALALTWARGGDLLAFGTLHSFVALSMCALAMLKLQDVYAFSNRFLGYDLLARRFVPYAFFYVAAELFVGLGMLAGVLTPVVAATALFIGGIGAVSVIKAVWVDGRELKCACVGGDKDVPLGAISLTENLMMVGMGVAMLVG